ncbi:MAG TPA: phosphoribosyltransferase [Terriglobales bacterium]|jgi:putative phosphoribosyl transferase|nr:phosphoribosyltransferase [Terriglobales bacterium]
MFRDRVDAGRQLAQGLAQYANRDDVLVLGIPRGGVTVAFEVAHALHAPLDILLVRKLGTPGQRELAMGAIASGGVRILNHRLISSLDISQEQLAETIHEQEAELRRREQLYRGVRAGLPVKGKIVVVVDDGIATGSSMLAAIDALRTLGPQKIVVAVPVAPAQARSQIMAVADELVCASMPEGFFAIGQFYQEFPQTEDAEIRELLSLAHQQAEAGTSEQQGAA